MLGAGHWSGYGYGYGHARSAAGKKKIARLIVGITN